jgi:hypothetical protein
MLRNKLSRPFNNPFARALGRPYKSLNTMGMLTSVARLRWQRWCIALALAFSCFAARAEVIFDVFVGYGLGASDGVVVQGAWLPVTCEVFNNGPAFNAVVEIQGGQFGNGARRLVPLELPSGTRKRFVVPVFCPSRSSFAVDARLKTDKGRLIAEHQNLQPRNNGHVDVMSPLIASMPRKHGAIVLPEPSRRNNQLSPAVTHLNTETFPENPIALEGISTLYLHSSRALDLKAPQYTALIAWLHGGGRLVLGVEQPGDVNSLPWLQTLLPCQLGGVVTNTDHGGLQRWLTYDLPEVNATSRSYTSTNVYSGLRLDDTFEKASLPLTEGKLRDGEVMIGTSDAPLAVRAQRGRGELVVLLFSPELAPFNVWANRNWFWARLSEVPHAWLAGTAVTTPMNPLDGVFGALVDSRQIKKLPIGWLLLLLVVYLVVIGPLDQIWLKKINRQMLTWITFPAYVVIFSGLIYFIGYTLRSGETEWNELQVVDVIPHGGGRADLRGRTFAAAYSPINASYSLESDQPFAALRGEVATAAGEQSEREDVVEQRGHSFKARVSVPVWTSQLYVNDWWRQDTAPLSMLVKEQGSQYRVEVLNPQNRPIAGAKLVIGGTIYELGSFSTGKTFNLSRGSGQRITQLVQQQQGMFASVIQQRRRQFGQQYGGHLEDVLTSATAASFLSMGRGSESDVNARNRGHYDDSPFISPRGFDLSDDVSAGAAVLIAHLRDATMAAPLNKFSPRMSRKSSVLRVITPVQR